MYSYYSFVKADREQVVIVPYSCYLLQFLILTAAISRCLPLYTSHPLYMKIICSLSSSCHFIFCSLILLCTLTIMPAFGILHSLIFCILYLIHRRSDHSSVFKLRFCTLIFPVYFYPSFVLYLLFCISGSVCTFPVSFLLLYIL